MFEHLAADTLRLREIKTKPAPWYVIESLLFENGYQAVVLYRAASWFKHRGVPVLGPLLARLCLLLTGVDIAPGTVILPGLRIAHGSGIVIGDRARIGRGALLLQQVTLGAPSQGRIGEMPTLGDNVFVGAGARLIGAITIGNDVFIGANAVVTRDIPAGSKVVSAAGLEVTTRPAPTEP